MIETFKLTKRFWNEFEYVRWLAHGRCRIHSVWSTRAIRISVCSCRCNRHVCNIKSYGLHSFHNSRRASSKRDECFCLLFLNSLKSDVFLVSAERQFSHNFSFFRCFYQFPFIVNYVNRYLFIYKHKVTAFEAILSSNQLHLCKEGVFSPSLLKSKLLRNIW